MLYKATKQRIHNPQQPDTLQKMPQRPAFKGAGSLP